MHREDRLSHNWLIKKLVNDKVRSHLGRLGGVVVDLGCGSRPYEQDILQHASLYVGLDWAGSMHGIHADVLANLSEPLPIGTSKADAVTCFEVMEHLPDPAHLLVEISRILAPGGTLLLSVPFQWWVHEEPHDYYRFTSHGLRHLLRRAGLDELSIEPTSGFWSMWVLKLNYQLARPTHRKAAGTRVLRWALIPFWWTGQSIALMLDRIWKEQRETAGYFVVARKAPSPPGHLAESIHR